LLPRRYRHGFPWPDAHHFHREAPPDQQDVGSTLIPAFDAAGSGPAPSATFGPSASLGLKRLSDGSPGDREAPVVVSASPAPRGARGALAGGLMSASTRRSAGLGGKALPATPGRWRWAGAKLGISAASG
jgi:hypothetical protein